ncbi:Helix-turn-helix domain [uncultured Clostridium sp.]|nr:Helix-turn-helix domain [uncultured Clostridium sp.]
MKKVMTVKDIQEVLGVCDKTAYRLVRKALVSEDMFRVVKLGKIYRIPSESFFNWMDEGCEGIIL